tara:strand:+ start:8678 stop:9796 length:1119 start_codon:yes stop_codon:yes gene_type:complete
MTYCANKILEVLKALDREEGIQQVNTLTICGLDKLASKLASIIQHASGFDSRLTSISRKQIIRLIDLEYGIEITSSNLTYLKKSHEFDLLKKIQGQLHAYSDDAQYNFHSCREGEVDIDYFPAERKLLSPQLLNLLIDRIDLDTTTMCEMWSKQGILGDKKTHFVPDVVLALRAKKFRNVRWPTSNTGHRAFAKLVCPKSISSLIAKAKGQTEFEELLHDKCKGLPNLPKKIDMLRYLSNAKTIEKVEPRYQDLPYFYVYKTPDGCKVGKADKTLRLNNIGERSKRNAFIFCLKKDGRDALSAERIESDFKRYMADLAILPVDGKKDHYKQNFSDVLNLFGCFLNREREIEYARSHAYICADYEYALSSRAK